MSKLVEHTKKKLNYAYELRKAVSNVKYPDVLYKDQIDDIKKKVLTMVDVVIEKQEAEFIESIVSSTSRPVKQGLVVIVNSIKNLCVVMTIIRKFYHQNPYQRILVV